MTLKYHIENIQVKPCRLQMYKYGQASLHEAYDENCEAKKHLKKASPANLYPVLYVIFFSPKKNHLDHIYFLGKF